MFLFIIGMLAILAVLFIGDEPKGSKPWHRNKENRNLSDAAFWLLVGEELGDDI